MNPEHLTFGIEIETIASRKSLDSGLQVGNYHSGLQVPYLPPGWKAERDGSIRVSPSHPVACEIVSPILRGITGLKTAIDILKVLKEKGHKVNTTCGFHVHVGWGSDLPSDKLAALIGIVAYLQDGIYATTGTKARERGRFCKKIRQYGKDGAKLTMDRDRFHILNIKRLADGFGTIEFRVFGGSLNPHKIAAWIQICLGIVERALTAKRLPKWEPTPPQGGWKSAGAGCSEVERLMAFLGWGVGAARNLGKTCGVLGQVANAIPGQPIKPVYSVKRMMCEVRRLAKKYDSTP